MLYEINSNLMAGAICYTAKYVLHPSGNGEIISVWSMNEVAEHLQFELGCNSIYPDYIEDTFYGFAEFELGFEENSQNSEGA